jgi:hypothetical protein
VRVGYQADTKNLFHVLDSHWKSLPGGKSIDYSQNIIAEYNNVSGEMAGLFDSEGNGCNQ